MARRGKRKLAICEDCKKPFVTLAVPFLFVPPIGAPGTEGQTYHETRCTGCRTAYAAAVHLEAAKRMAAKVPEQRAATAREAAKFADKHPGDVCERCKAGKSCSILSSQRGPS